VRATTPRIFAVDSASSPIALRQAAERRRLRVVTADSGTAATLMAAVTGELADAPGAVFLADADEARAALRYAVASRAPLIAVVEQAIGAEATALVKGVVEAEPMSAAHWIAHAVHLALRDPRGPVIVRVARQASTEVALPVGTSVRPIVAEPSSGALDDAARLLANAARPVLIVGLECRIGDAPGWLRPFVETLPAPSLTTVKGKGVLPDPHPLMLGLVGSAIGQSLLDRADLVVAAGVDAVELRSRPWPTATPVLHLGRTSHAEALGPTVEVIGDIALLLEELAPRLRGRSRADWDVAELDRLKRSATSLAGSDRSPESRVLRIARELTPAGTIAAVGPVTHVGVVAAAWAAVAPNELLMDAELADVAPAAAAAAALHHPDRHVICVTTTPPALDVMERLACSIVTISLGPVPALVGGMATAIARDDATLRATLDRFIRRKEAVLIDASSIEG
jgi:acetolactate synthase-1/2/3 large subunit